MQVFAASARLAVFLFWGANHFDWVALRSNALWRVGLLAAMLIGAMVIYFGALWAVRLNLKQVLRR